MSVGLVHLSLISRGLPFYLQISPVEPIAWDDARSNIGVGEARIPVSLTSFMERWLNDFSIVAFISIGLVRLSICQSLLMLLSLVSDCALSKVSSLNLQVIRKHLS